MYIFVDIHVEHAKKQLHMSLGYQHQPDQHEKLDKLAREIDLSADCKWEIRLYSRDARLAKQEVIAVEPNTDKQSGIPHAEVTLIFFETKITGKLYLWLEISQSEREAGSDCYFFQL